MMHILVRFALSLLVMMLFIPHAMAREKARSLPEQILEASRNASFIEKISREVKKYLGVRYRAGGSSEKGFDCSGFTRVIYRRVFGIDLASTVRGQYSMPIFHTVSLEELSAGDLVFFSRTVRKKKLSHVGIYLSNGYFAHAAVKKGVTVSSVKETHWKSRILSARSMAGLHGAQESEILNLSQMMGAR